MLQARSIDMCPTKHTNEMSEEKLQQTQPKTKASLGPSKGTITEPLEGASIIFSTQRHVEPKPTTPETSSALETNNPADDAEERTEQKLSQVHPLGGDIPNTANPTSETAKIPTVADRIRMLQAAGLDSCAPKPVTNAW